MSNDRGGTVDIYVRLKVGGDPRTPSSGLPVHGTVSVNLHDLARAVDAVKDSWWRKLWGK